MIQTETLLRVTDNSGAKKVKCIKVLGGFRRKYANYGDLIVVSIRDVKQHKKKKVKIKEGETAIFVLPGVPAEMKAIFLNVIKPILKEKRGKFVEKGFIFMGIGESQIAPYVTKLEEKYPQLWIKTHPRIGLAVEVEVSITCFNVENGEEMAEKALKEVKEVIIKLNGEIKE